MSTLEISERLGDWTMNLSSQIRTAISVAVLEDDCLLGLIHQIAENPDRYSIIFGSKIIRMSTAYRHAVDSLMELDELMEEEAEQLENHFDSGIDMSSKKRVAIEFPVDIYSLPTND